MANIVSTVPAAGSDGAYKNQWISVIFDTNLDPLTIKASTVILVKTSDQELVESAPVYYKALKKIEVRIVSLLEANTSYTLILIGGTYGIKELVSGLPFSNTSYQFSFTTSDLTDANMPLAKSIDAAGAGWSGTDGIYKIVHEATGEPISHIVTDSTTIGPSGYIGPGVTADYYLVSAEVDDFAVMSTNPEDDETNVLTTLSGILIEFNQPLVPSEWEWTSSSSGITIEYNDILGYEIFDDSALTFTFYPFNEILAIETDLRNSTDYNITISKNFASNVVAAGTLGTEYSFNFRTKISPFYSSVRVMKALLGSLIINIADHEIEKIIYEMSLKSIELAAEGNQGAWTIDEPTTAAKNYVKCAAQLELIMRTFGAEGDISAKQLGDLAIKYGNNIDRKLKNKIISLIKCIEANETLIKYGTKVVSPATPVKGSKDDRRMGWRRLNNNGEFV